MAKRNYQQYANSDPSKTEEMKPVAATEANEEANSVEPAAEKKTKKFESFTGTIANAQYVNCRGKGSISSAPVSVLTLGDTVEVVGESKEWYKINLVDGKTGYVMKDYIEQA